jgi:small subunit ribosomal protein S20
MAHHRAAIKSIRQDAKRTERNRERKTRVRSSVKDVELALAKGNKEEATKALRAAQKELLRAADKGVMKLGTASRKFSRLNKKVKALIEGKLNVAASEAKPQKKAAAPAAAKGAEKKAAKAAAKKKTAKE